MHDIWHDVVHYFTHADKGIFQLLKALSTKTGTVAREYVSGRRKKYFPPLNFFLIVAALYVFMGSIIPANSVGTAKNNTPVSYQQSHTPKEVGSYNRMTEKRINVAHFFTRYANFVAMFAAPFISLLIWVIYRKGPYNFTEHLVANLYLIGFTNLIRCIIYSPALALLHINPSAKPAYTIIALFEIAYRAVFYYQFMGEFTIGGKLKSLGLAVLALFAWWLLVFGLTVAYMNWG